jgi:hypothetical protein
VRGAQFYDRRHTGAYGIRTANREGMPEVLPLFQAVSAGRIGVYVWGRRDKPFPAAEIARATVPTLFVLQDFSGTPNGPDAWTCAGASLEWAGRRFHAYSQNMGADFYTAIVEGAQELGHYMLVQTVPKLVNAWQRAAGWRRWG